MRLVHYGCRHKRSGPVGPNENSSSFSAPYGRLMTGHATTLASIEKHFPSKTMHYLSAIPKIQLHSRIAPHDYSEGSHISCGSPMDLLCMVFSVYFISVPKHPTALAMYDLIRMIRFSNIRMGPARWRMQPQQFKFARDTQKYSRGAAVLCGLVLSQPHR